MRARANLGALCHVDDRSACFAHRGNVVEHVQKRGLARLLLRWPEYRSSLQRRAQDDPYLLDLIGAYETACEAVEYWSRADNVVARERAEEYRQLLMATEHDILAKIV
jgi:hypothetical protein